MSNHEPCLCGDPMCPRCFPRAREITEIKRARWILGAGNSLEFFYNPENKVLVVDIIDKDEKGGNELLRCVLDEDSLLQHLKEEPKEKVFEVVEYSSGFAVRHIKSGDEKWLSDGVDVFEDLQPGQEGFVERWTEVMNEDPEETYAAYFYDADEK